MIEREKSETKRKKGILKQSSNLIQRMSDERLSSENPNSL